MDDVRAAPMRRYRCPGCGYGATRQTEPEQCPMCQGSTWQEEGWSPFSALAIDLAPAAAPMAGEMASP